MDEISPAEARSALEAVTRGRLAVVDRIQVPAWYWWSVALGWVALGVITDLRIAWLTTLATLLFGAAHASVAARAVDGRHGDGVAVRAEVVGRRVAPLVLGGLVALAVVTVAVALLLDADGARHPVTGASVLVAVVVLLGGPLLISRVRRSARVAALS